MYAGISLLLLLLLRGMDRVRPSMHATCPTMRLQPLTDALNALTFVHWAYPALAHDTRVLAALAKGVGGDPAFQGDPGPLLEIPRELSY